MSMFDLTGKTALVTGARRGLGLAMARALAEAGADIIAASANQDPSGGELGEAVRGLGRTFEGHKVDLGRRSEVSSLADAVADRVDILVNNAGTQRRAPAVEFPTEWWDEVLEVNLTSQFLLAQRVGARMLERGEGRVIFTASILSYQGGITIPAYAAAKAGVAGAVKALSNEWSGRGVTVNAIAPGYIATDNNVALRDDPERARAILERIPAGRWGRAEDVASATVFLASPASSFVTGIVLPVDGGWLAR